jgi:hypothetical protein
LTLVLMICPITLIPTCGLYVKQFSSLRYGAPVYSPCDVQLGYVGFIDTQDGFFQKLYNVADPPKNDVAGCPDPLELVKCETLLESWEAIHASTRLLSLSLSDSCGPS